MFKLYLEKYHKSKKLSKEIEILKKENRSPFFYYYSFFVSFIAILAIIFNAMASYRLILLDSFLESKFISSWRDIFKDQLFLKENIDIIYNPIFSDAVFYTENVARFNFLFLVVVSLSGLSLFLEDVVNQKKRMMIFLF